MATKKSNQTKELTLSNFTLENLHEAVLWIASDGTILQVNETTCQLSGYTKDELLGMNILQLNPTEYVADFSSYWKQLKKKKQLIFQSKHRHKSGDLYDVEISANFIVHNGEEFSCSIVTDIKRKKYDEELLRTVSEATSGLTGKDFFLGLARHITLAMGMRYALITECASEERTRLRTLCYVDGQQVLDNIEYDVKGIPCEIIMRGEDFFMACDVQKLFPKEKGLESYIGVPIFSPVNGEVVGHIIAVDPAPVRSERNQTAVLKIFAARVGAELERMRAAKELDEKNKELKKRLKEIELYQTTINNLQDQVFWLDKKGAFIQVNNQVSQASGFAMEELKTMSVFDINPSLSKEEWQKKWGETQRCGKQVLESKHRKKNGHLYPVEITNTFFTHDGVEYFCSIVRDLRKKKMEEELLRTVSEHTASVVGEDYFLALAKCVTSSLQVRFAMVNKFSNAQKTKLRMLAYVDRHEVLEGYEYDTKGTPCELVMKGNEFFCAQDVEVSYPREKGIQSWVSVPIYSPTTGEIIGNIGAFDRVPMNRDQNQTAILRIFAARAGAEMERVEAQQNLEKANSELQLRLQEIERLKNQLQAENKYLQEEIKLNHNFEDIISISKKFQKVLHQIEQVAETDATVLVLGESGTGKELIARAIHNISNRRRKPLVKINCAALPANLIESELFGHERGAFTGAMDKKIGRFELADGGTVFLDEIGELPIELQAKLLRVLQEGEFERLGNSKTMKVDVRVIAATNRNLEQALEKKEFREDLYYRLNVFPIVCPPLRERKEDIPFLVKHFCQKHEVKAGKKVTAIPSKVMDALTAYHWPGNIRELENIIERAIILSRNGAIEYGDWMPMAKSVASAKNNLLRLDDVEKEHIMEVLKQTGWQVSGEKGAAKILGLNATTLEARMKKLGISRQLA